MGILNALSYTMPTVGLVASHGQLEESLLIGKVHLFPKIQSYSQFGFFVLLIVSSLDVMYCNSASAYKTITPIKTETFSLVGVVRWS